MPQLDHSIDQSICVGLRVIFPGQNLSRYSCFEFYSPRLGGDSANDLVQVDARAHFPGLPVTIRTSLPACCRPMVNAYVRDSTVPAEIPTAISAMKAGPGA